MNSNVYETVAEGRYTAKPTDWRYNVSSGGKPYVEVKLKFHDGAANRTLTYRGFLTEKTKKNTLKALLAMGFSDENLNRFNEGAPGKALNADQDVSIVVQHETNQENGKTYAKVRWINPVGGSKFKALADQGKITESLAALDIRGDMMELKTELGVPTQPAPTTADFGDLPF